MILPFLGLECLKISDYLCIPMSFVYPAFLFSLFALAIPIIIHLFNFRKFKNIYFTNVRFLKEVKQESQSRSRLKHLVVLLSRILALAFLVFAFSQPYLPADDAEEKPASGSQTVSIFIDNSFSMDAVNDNGRLFEQAKQLSTEIAKAYQPTDNFQLLTNDFESRHQRLVNREELIEIIDETEISSSTKNISEIIMRQKEAASTAQNGSLKTFFIISDFQKTIFDFNAIIPDTSIHVKLIPLQSVLSNNLYVDSCWFASPVRKLNAPDELHVRVVNKSENNYENVPIKFSVNGQIRAIGTSISLPANSKIDTVLNFTSTAAGWQNATVEITDFPITFDDKFFLSYRIAENINILCISQLDSIPSIQSLFGKDSFFSLQVTSPNRIDYSSFGKQNLIILSESDSLSSGLGQELKKFIENGGSLLIFPSEKINLNSYKDFLSQVNLNYFETIDSALTKVSNINLEHIIYENVFEKPTQVATPENIDLPVVHKQYRLSRHTQTNEEWLMKTQNGNNLLSRYSIGNGFVYLASIPLKEDFSNFTKHAIFVPTLFQIALHSMETGKLFYIIGRDNFIELNSPVIQKSGQENIFHIVSENKSFDFIPESKTVDSRVRLFIHDQIKNSGNYFITKGNETAASFAFNYDRKESDLSAFSPSELENLVQSSSLKNFSLVDSDVKIIGKKIGEISEGIKLWKYCIILALLFFTAEVVLLRWWK